MKYNFYPLSTYFQRYSRIFNCNHGRIHSPQKILCQYYKLKSTILFAGGTLHLYVDNKLKWETHIKSIKNKLNSMLHILYRLRHIITNKKNSIQHILRTFLQSPNLLKLYMVRIRKIFIDAIICYSKQSNKIYKQLTKIHLLTHYISSISYHLIS